MKNQLLFALLSFKLATGAAVAGPSDSMSLNFWRESDERRMRVGDIGLHLSSESGAAARERLAL